MKNMNTKYAIEISGFIAVILSLVFVAVELDQSQNAMEAEALAYKNERSAELSLLSYELNIIEISKKLVSNEELSDDEAVKLRVFGNALMWHLETIHFEYTQGFVDDELWDATLTRIGFAVDSPWFSYLYPNWGNGASSGFRASYVELVGSVIE